MIVNTTIRFSSKVWTGVVVAESLHIFVQFLSIPSAAQFTRPIWQCVLACMRLENAPDSNFLWRCIFSGQGVFIARKNEG